jgi:uncharacterized short protein YbdD (DUF466 family)
MSKLFDIVIPVGPDDISIIHNQIEYTKLNIIGYRNIYIISYDPTLEVKDCIIVSETLFPFNKELIQKSGCADYRCGWYLQQLLKLYAGLIIPDILDTYLIIDGDTFFLKPVSFMEENKCLYNYLGEYWKLYFSHMKKLHPSFEKVDLNKSGVTHHMMFQTKYVRELMDLVENYHGKYNFYEIFLECIDHIDRSGASEYEIYFNYMLKYHPDEIKWRELKHKNKKRCLDFSGDMDCDYVSVHSWI